MKKYLLILLCYSFLSSAFAESNLPERLAKAYSINNELIYEKAPIDAQKSIDFLTTNYIEQLKYFKQLSDEKLGRELRQQNLSFIRDKTLLQKHILNLYEHEAKSLQVCKPSIYERVWIGEEKGDKKHAVILIHKIMNIFNGMNKDPELVRELHGIMPREIVNEWYFEALENKRKMFPSNREFKQMQVRLVEEGVGDTQIFYVFGQLMENEVEQPMMMRMVIEKGAFGLFVREVAQTMNPILVQRMEKVSHKLEFPH